MVTGAGAGDVEQVALRVVGFERCAHGKRQTANCSKTLLIDFELDRRNTECPPGPEFVNVAIEANADAILVSSMYGMGPLDCEGFRQKCIETGLEDIILDVGGTVAVPLELERNRPDIERRFREIGFNCVFKNTCAASEAVAVFKADLGIGD
jgi:methylaspartate mutase sigma subunit